MRKAAHLVLMALSGCGSGGITVLVPVPAGAPAPFPAPAALDGPWVLADAAGQRSCLVIQEDRVSIVNLTCSADPRGFVARITQSPVITRSGDTIMMTVTFNPQTADERVSRLTFVGVRQFDDSFQGHRRDEDLDPTGDPREQFAVLSRE